MIKRVFLLILLAALGFGGAWGGWRYWTAWHHQETTDNAYVQSDITAISAKVAGHVVEVAVADNRPVTKGQVLLRIDDRDFRARVDEARATVAGRRAELNNIDTRLSLQSTVIASAEADRAVADAEVTRVAQELQRSRHLARDDYASRQRLERDEADAAKAAARRRAAQAAVDGAEAQLEVLRAERQVGEANLRRAEAALAAAELDLDGTVVRAPVDGIVGNRGVQMGQYVRPGAVLMAVVPLHAVWIEANFKETQIRRLAPGQPVRVVLDAFPDDEIAGTVDSFAPASGAEFSLLPPENATGNFTKVVQRIPVRIRLDTAGVAEGRLRPGLSAVVAVDTAGAAAGTALAAGR